MCPSRKFRNRIPAFIRVVLATSMAFNEFDHQDYGPDQDTTYTLLVHRFDFVYWDSTVTSTEDKDKEISA